jgi:hypothetical protein
MDKPVRYVYGMRARGFSPGAQPKEGFIERMDDPLKGYYDLIVYNRELDGTEIYKYELDFIRAEIL